VVTSNRFKYESMVQANVYLAICCKAIDVNPRFRSVASEELPARKQLNSFAVLKFRFTV